MNEWSLEEGVRPAGTHATGSVSRVYLRMPSRLMRSAYRSKFLLLT